MLPNDYFELLTIYEMQQNHINILKLLLELVTALSIAPSLLRKQSFITKFAKNHAARKIQSAAQNSFTDA